MRRRSIRRGARRRTSRYRTFTRSPLCAASSEALIVFDPCRIVAPFCSTNVCLPAVVFTTMAVARRQRGRVCRSPIVREAASSPAPARSASGRAAARRTGAAHGAPAKLCNRQDDMSAARTTPGWTGRSCRSDKNARQRRSWRSRPGSPANCREPAGINPEHNPGATSGAADRMKQSIPSAMTSIIATSELEPAAAAQRRPTGAKMRGRCRCGCGSRCWWR